MVFEEIIQNFVDNLYKECATQLIVKFNMAVLGYDNNHTLYEYNLVRSSNRLFFQFHSSQVHGRNHKPDNDQALIQEPFCLWNPSVF